MQYKVVYNDCFGGFYLSERAHNKLIELGANPKYLGELSSSFMKNAEMFADWHGPRHDPILIKVIEELGEKANGPFSDLQIATVVGPYRIDNYDGIELVKEPHTVKWIDPNDA